MGRRRRDNFLMDVIGIASKLPWKASLGLAVFCWAVLHGVATVTAPAPVVKTTADRGSVVIHQAIHTGATLLQFIIPFACLIGAAVSYFKQRKSVSLVDEVRSGSGRDVGALSWQEFESLVAGGFRQQGFAVAEKGGSSPDGGIDMVLSRGRDKYLVQCKQWRAQQVGVTVIRELYGVMAAEHAAGGYVVTSGRFTKDALEFAAGRNIELIDGGVLNTLLREPVTRPVPATFEPIKVAPSSGVAPKCPRCQTPMVSRVAKQGPNSGGPF